MINVENLKEISVEDEDEKNLKIQTDKYFIYEDSIEEHDDKNDIILSSNNEKLNILDGSNLKSKRPSKKYLNGIHTNSIDITIKDFFLRKTESNFIKKSLSPLKSARVTYVQQMDNRNDYNSMINILKSDIIQLDNLIRDHSDILTYYKQPNKNGFNLMSCRENTNLKMSNGNLNFQKKITELTINNNIKISDYFDKILENTKNLKNLHQEFKTDSKDQLIKNMALELYYNRLFITKYNDLTFLINLTHNSENITNLSNSHSKIIQLKILIEKISNIYKNKDDECCILKKNYSTLTQDEDIDKVLEFKTISELLKFNSRNILINHMKQLFTQLNDKSYQIFSDLASALVNSNKNLLLKLRKTEDIIENFIILRKIIEDMYKTIENDNKNLKDELEKIKTENENLKTKINDFSSKNIEFLFDQISKESIINF